ncbi:MAG TPA: AMP-binding protein [Thermohalobaculum sp.]|nr:AMP-binding protein [Thermohalobaculum sp.]
MSEHYDDLETRDPGAREAALFQCLRAQLGAALARAPGLARHLDGVEPGTVADRAALARLPVLRKAALIELQAADPPFGGLTTRPAAGFEHIFQSPGPIYEPGMSSTPDWWRIARALHAAGFRRGAIVHNSFAYHLTPGGHMLESAARALGCPVIAGGVGNTEAQVAAAAQAGATAYMGTPDFLRVMLEKAAELGRDLSAIRRAWVSGGPLFPSLRAEYEARGIACLQGYATADVGLIAYEIQGEAGAREGMVVDEGVILEIVRPGTGAPVPEGEVGEVLVTVLNADYPLIRFATGDLSAVLPGPSPCGRTNLRIKGWMGRADQTTKVKGMFVRPEQVAEIVRRHAEVLKARLTVSRAGEQDAMTLAVEAQSPGPELAARLRETMLSVLKLRGEVEAGPPGSLPNDGKVIDDIRKFD